MKEINILESHKNKLSREPLKTNERGQMFFIENFKEIEGGENKIKRFFKRYSFLYKILRFIASPVLKHFSYLSSDFIEGFEKESLVLNVGSGNSNLSERIVNLDITPFDNVNMVAFAHELPFGDRSVDGIVAEVLLEHVPNVREVVNEFYRVLKPGGKVYVTAPFLYPFHAVPGDYNRWSKSGLKLLFKDFSPKRVEVYAGAVTTTVLSLSYLLALPFSVISKTFYEYATYFFMILMFPLKFLDPLFRKLPGADYSASIFVAVFEK